MKRKRVSKKREKSRRRREGRKESSRKDGEDRKKNAPSLALCRRVVSQRARVPAHAVSRVPSGLLRSCLALTSFGSLRSSTPWRHLRIRSLMAFTSCWFRPRSSWRQTMCSLPRACALPLLRALPCPSALRLDVGRFCSARAALVPQESAESASTVRALSLPTPHGAPASLHPPSQLVRIHLTPLRLAAVTNAADTRKKAKRSMWRVPLVAMWGCYDVPSSDDDEHNMGNPLLQLCAHALVAPSLLSGFVELDDLWVALSCRFPLDVWTIMQQDYPSADQESSACSGSPVLMSLDAPCELVTPQTPGASTCGRA